VEVTIVVRVPAGFVFALGHADENCASVCAEAKARRADQVADVFDDQLIPIARRKSGSPPISIAA